MTHEKVPVNRKNDIISTSCLGSSSAERFLGKKEVESSILSIGSGKIMAKKPYVKLQCTVCKRINYHIHKSKGKGPSGEKKLELKKFCKWCRKHTAHKESKK